nr:MAG TPA: hypothetical protein [Caudoviricetes sp.]
MRRFVTSSKAGDYEHAICTGVVDEVFIWIYYRD